MLILYICTPGAVNITLYQAWSCTWSCSTLAGIFDIDKAQYDGLEVSHIKFTFD